MFHSGVLNYPTYDKEIYSLVQDVNKWKNHIIKKETIIHIYHKPLQYLQAQRELYQTKHYKLMGFLH
jgi:hypothetical protein